MHDADKRAAAAAAVREVEGGMLVGLGTGSTASVAIRLLGERVAAGLAVSAVATSLASEALARQCGIRVLDFAEVAQVDLTIDGADEIDPSLRAIKGAGGAMVREKVVADAARRMVVIADGSKRVATLGAAKVPVEVLPFAAAFATDRLAAVFGHVERRLAAGAEYRTDNGNLVLDCRGSTRRDWADVAATLDAIPGVIGHGLFLTEVDGAYVATGGVVSRLERSAAPA